VKDAGVDVFADRMMELYPQWVRGMARFESNYLIKGVITLPQVWALHYLSRHKECPMSALAESMKLGLSSVTGMVDRLVKQNLAERRRAENDRRVVFVDISAKGRAVLKQILDQRRKFTVKLFGSLTARERSNYLNILGKLVNELLKNGN